MKKIIFLIVFSSAFFLAPVALAKDENEQVNIFINASVDLPASVSATCDPNSHWKNHGEFVSCVAKLHPGGAVVSRAARSHVGDDEDNVTPTPDLSVNTTASASATTTVNNDLLQKLIDAINRLIQELQHIFHI